MSFCCVSFSYPLLSVTDIACSMFVTEYPPCDCNEEHTAVTHCPECEGQNRREHTVPMGQRTHTDRSPHPLCLPLVSHAENFCSDCDVMIHARKKNKDHTREPIELQPEEEPEPEPEPEVELEPVPCDSDASHIAVMYCEDCEENFCGSELRGRSVKTSARLACPFSRRLMLLAVFAPLSLQRLRLRLPLSQKDCEPLSIRGRSQTRGH